MPLTLDHLPPNLREKVKYLTELTNQHEVETLRDIRDKSKDMIIDIYHHSYGTDSYYSDLEKRYFTWSQLITHSKQLMESGANLFTSVVEYPPNKYFISGSTAPKPSSN